MKVWTGQARHVHKVTGSGPFPVNQEQRNVSATGVVTYSSSPGWCPGNSELFDSYYAPGFNELKRDGWLVFFPYTKSSTSWTYSPGTVYDYTYTGTSPVKLATAVITNIVNGFQSFGSFPTTPVADFSKSISRAQDEVLTKVFAKAQTPEVDMLVDLSQINQLIRMLIETGHRILTLVKSPGAFFRYIKTNSVDKYTTARVPGNPHGRLSELAGLWCELRFGWRPLLVSMDGLATALIEGTDAEPKRITYRSMEEISSTESASVIYASAMPGATITLTSKVSVQATVRGGILLERSRTGLQKMGFEWEAIPYAAYDLVPWSFIWDRFINLGSWIRALRPVPSDQFGGAWVTTRILRRTTYTGVYSGTDVTTGSGAAKIRSVRVGSSNTAEEVYDLVSRQIFRHPPIFPTLKWDWSQITDLYNVLDGIMLAIQRAASLRRSVDRRY